MQKQLFREIDQKFKNQIEQVDDLYEVYSNDTEIEIIYIESDGELYSYITYKKFDYINIYMVYSFIRKKGYATLLLNSITENCLLEVDNGNSQAIKIYEQNGFREIDERYNKKVYERIRV